MFSESIQKRYILYNLEYINELETFSDRNKYLNTNSYRDYNNQSLNQSQRSYSQFNKSNNFKETINQNNHIVEINHIPSCFNNFNSSNNDDDIKSTLKKNEETLSKFGINPEEDIDHTKKCVDNREVLLQRILNQNKRVSSIFIILDKLARRTT